jgi:hypothetical protein
MFGRKKKAPNLDESEMLKTDPGFRTASGTIKHCLDTLDAQIEAKRMTRTIAKRVTQTVKETVDFRLRHPKKA